MTMGPAPIIIIFLMSVRLLELVALSQARKTGDSSASAMARIEPPRMGRVTFLRLAWVVTRALAGTPSVFARAAADAIFLLQFKLEEVVVGKGKNPPTQICWGVRGLKNMKAAAEFDTLSLYGM